MFTQYFNSRARTSGMTVLEVATVVLIIAILACMLMPVYATIAGRAERTGCTANLRSLHVAADLYIQEHRTWPQIKVSGSTEDDTARAWISALRPYGLEPISWACPTSQKKLGNPDLNDPANVRIDYLATPFQPGQQIPFKWANQPWFVERSNEHGNGNLIVFPDGHVEAMFEVMQRLKVPNPTH